MRIDSLLQSIEQEDPKAFRKLGLRNARYLGCGSYGRVFEAKGYALKFSREKCEVKAANRLQGRKFKHIVRIHGVWKVGQEYYVVKQQKLFDPPNEVKWIVDRMGVILERRWHLKRSPQKLADAYRDYIGSWNQVDVQRVSYVAQALCRAFQDLSSVGITGYKDLHEYNVMQDGRGTLKLIDFGLTRIPGKFQEPPVVS